MKKIFIEEILPALIALGHEITHVEKDGRYTINTDLPGKPKVSKIDYYPKANKVLIHRSNTWISSGFDWIVTNLINS